MFEFLTWFFAILGCVLAIIGMKQNGVKWSARHTLIALFTFLVIGGIGVFLITR